MRRMKNFFILTSLFIFCAPAFSQGALYTDSELKVSIPFGPKYDYSNIKVTRVIDGQTVQLENGERVRLIGISIPESKPDAKAQRDSERTGQDLATITKMGKEATEFVKGLIKPGQEVRLEFDVQEKDKYGRLLAYVYVFVCGPYCDYDMPMEYQQSEYENKIYIDLNATIIKSGYAQPMTVPPNVKYADVFQKLYDEARESKRGLWAGHEGWTPDLPDYEALSQACRQNKVTSGCCLSSVSRMRDVKALLASGDTFAQANCPQGYQPDTLKCLGSYRWCSPL